MEEGLVLAARMCEKEKETKENLKRKFQEKLKQRHIRKKGNGKKGRRKKFNILQGEHGIVQMGSIVKIKESAQQNVNHVIKIEHRFKRKIPIKND